MSHHIVECVSQQHVSFGERPDAVGELPLETQVALPRVLQERQFERVGGSRVIPADFVLLLRPSTLDHKIKQLRIKKQEVPPGPNNYPQLKSRLLRSSLIFVS